MSLLALVTLFGCGGADAGPDGPREQPTSRLVLATTTSVDDAGLLDALVPAFRRAHPGLDVQVMAVGSGQALALGRRDDADVLLVHDPAAESLFVARGHALDRRTIMRNDFLLVGPAADPAGVAGSADVLSALGRIARAGGSARQPASDAVVFLSRGDSSGTHRRELALWREAGVAPGGDWYRQAGLGMGDLLRMASEQAAYTLTDLATYRFLDRPAGDPGGLHLDVLVRGGPRLVNPYSIILVEGAPDPDGARALFDWLAGPGARDIIARHGRARFGEPLFRPESSVRREPLVQPGPPVPVD